jgi:hypothetical protein
MNWIVLTSLILLVGGLIMSIITVSTNSNTSNIQGGLDQMNMIKQAINSDPNDLSGLTPLVNFLMAMSGSIITAYIYGAIFLIFSVILFIQKERALGFNTSVIFGIFGAGGFGWAIFSSVSVNNMATLLGPVGTVAATNVGIQSTTYINSIICVGIAVLSLFNFYGRRR